MICSICHEEKDCIGEPPVCDECGGRVATMYMGEFVRMRQDLTREKAAAANLAGRMTKLVNDQDDRAAGMMSEHQLVKQELADRISKARRYLMSLRAWPVRRFVDRAVAHLDGDA